MHGETVHWVTGSLGTLIHYLDDSPERTGTTSLVADVVGAGIGAHGTFELVEVVEEADEDLNGWDFAPAGGNQP